MLTPERVRTAVSRDIQACWPKGPRPTVHEDTTGSLRVVEHESVDGEWFWREVVLRPFRARRKVLRVVTRRLVRRIVWLMPRMPWQWHNPRTRKHEFVEPECKS